VTGDGDGSPKDHTSGKKMTLWKLHKNWMLANGKHFYIVFTCQALNIDGCSMYCALL
jgi:hypothetical protein